MAAGQFHSLEVLSPLYSLSLQGCFKAPQIRAWTRDNCSGSCSQKLWAHVEVEPLPHDAFLRQRRLAALVPFDNPRLLRVLG